MLLFVLSDLMLSISLFMWFSVNAVLTTIPIGVLGQSVFTLTLPYVCNLDDAFRFK